MLGEQRASRGLSPVALRLLLPLLGSGGWGQDGSPGGDRWKVPGMGSALVTTGEREHLEKGESLSGKDCVTFRLFWGVGGGGRTEELESTPLHLE